MFLNVKLQRLCKSHHLQCITSSKVSEKLDKSLCVRDKAKDLCWMPVVLGPSDDTASLISMILMIDITKWAQEYFQKPLSVNTIRRAICRCQLQLYHAKRKPYVNMVQKRHHVLWAKAHLKWTVSKWKSVLWSDESVLLNICNVIYVLLWITYCLMWFESLLAFILLKFKKRPNISKIRVVFQSGLLLSKYMYYNCIAYC